MFWLFNKPGLATVLAVLLLIFGLYLTAEQTGWPWPERPAPPANTGHR